MKKLALTGKTQEQLVDLLKEKKAELTKMQMVFGQKPSLKGVRKDIARIETQLSALAKQTN